jgi:hypothetical protein
LETKTTITGHAATTGIFRHGNIISKMFGEPSVDGDNIKRRLPE